MGRGIFSFFKSARKDSHEFLPVVLNEVREDDPVVVEEFILDDRQHVRCPLIDHPFFKLLVGFVGRLLIGLMRERTQVNLIL